MASLKYEIRDAIDLLKDYRENPPKVPQGIFHAYLNLSNQLRSLVLVCCERDPEMAEYFDETIGENVSTEEREDADDNS